MPEMANSRLLARGNRLSVMPLTDEEFAAIVAAGASGSAGPDHHESELNGLAIAWRPLRESGCVASGSALADQREAVAHREEVAVDPVVGGDRVVERLERFGVLVAGAGSTTRPDHSVLSTMISPFGRSRGTSSSK